MLAQTKLGQTLRERTGAQIGARIKKGQGEIPDQCPVCGGGEFAYDHERGEIVCAIYGPS